MAAVNEYNYWFSLRKSRARRLTASVIMEMMTVEDPFFWDDNGTSITSYLTWTQKAVLLSLIVVIVDYGDVNYRLELKHLPDRFQSRSQGFLHVLTEVLGSNCGVSWSGFKHEWDLGEVIEDSLSALVRLGILHHDSTSSVWVPFCLGVHEPSSRCHSVCCRFTGRPFKFRDDLASDGKFNLSISAEGLAAEGSRSRQSAVIDPDARGPSDQVPGVGSTVVRFPVQSAPVNSEDVLGAARARMIALARQSLESTGAAATKASLIADCRTVIPGLSAAQAEDVWKALPATCKRGKGRVPSKKT